MSRFQELDEYIYETLLTITSSQNLCKYLKYATDKETNPLSMSDLSEEERFSLIFDRIYPLPKLPDEKLVDAASYVTVYFDNIEKGGSQYFKNSVLVFNVICHLEKWLMPSKLRPNQIMHEIDTLFNGKRDMGIGGMEFVRSNFIYVNKDFAGYSMRYRIVDFS